MLSYDSECGCDIEWTLGHTRVDIFDFLRTIKDRPALIYTIGNCKGLRSEPFSSQLTRCEAFELLWDRLTLLISSDNKHSSLHAKTIVNDFMRRYEASEMEVIEECPLSLFLYVREMLFFPEEVELVPPIKLGKSKVKRALNFDEEPKRKIAKVTLHETDNCYVTVFPMAPEPVFNKENIGILNKKRNVIQHDIIVIDDDDSDIALDEDYMADIDLNDIDDGDWLLNYSESAKEERAMMKKLSGKLRWSERKNIEKELKSLREHMSRFELF